ncbi:hypothetical protein NEF87_002061 [Candidatus Lokiarchaeum ossiferum]|uniref:Uncharacterized protein n=1 Tax=Candidatus Lokiarchaeum ossiferum TaxID=2951803 RepID=A0ABY6HQI9_9ARCH|nr:hypothetical protein NEF87_002061 [Candidatus Lokiarchaeum sp. B-35]
MVADKSKKNRDGSKNDKVDLKKAFTIRIEQSILDNLKKASDNTRLRQATQARTYLQMSQFVVTQSNLGIEAYDRSPMGLYPKKIWGNLLESLPENKQFEVGDSLGMMILTNCGIMQIESLESKMDFLAGLGWFDIRMFPEREETNLVNYYGILAHDWPINVVHALLFRILTQHEFPSKLTVKTIKNYYGKTVEQIRSLSRQKKNADIYNTPEPLIQYIETLDGREQNYSPDCSFYIFNKLKTEG